MMMLKYGLYDGTLCEEAFTTTASALQRALVLRYIDGNGFNFLRITDTVSRQTLVTERQFQEWLVDKSFALDRL